MKKEIEKTIVILLIVFMVLNCIIPHLVYAVSTDDEAAFGISLTGVIDTVIGFFVYPWKAIFIVPGIVGNLILTEIASVGSDTIEEVTLETILFNKLSLVDINIFSITTNANGGKVSGTIQEIRQNIANWYYAFRNFAIVAFLATLIYIGIRMAFDNIAEKRAKYKQMLINWAMGFGLLFVLHYFIIIVLNANTLLIKAFSPNEVTGRTRFHEFPIRVSFWNLTCAKLGISYFI